MSFEILPTSLRRLTRICSLIPIVTLPLVYSIISLFSLIFYSAAGYLEPVSRIFEAIAIVSFFLFIKGAAASVHGGPVMKRGAHVVCFKSCGGCQTTDHSVDRLHLRLPTRNHPTNPRNRHRSTYSQSLSVYVRLPGRSTDHQRLRPHRHHHCNRWRSHLPPQDPLFSTAHSTVPQVFGIEDYDRGRHAGVLDHRSRSAENKYCEQDRCHLLRLVQGLAGCCCRLRNAAVCWAHALGVPSVRPLCDQRAHESQRSACKPYRVQ